MDIVKLHELIDQWAADERAKDQVEPVEGETVPVPEEPARVLPEGKRVVTTKTQGDRVYLIDEVKKTRQWVTKPEILEGLGFEFGDVKEVDDTEFLKYQMGSPIYRLPDAQ